MAAPFISICISTYNRTKYLPRLLDSIINQSFKDYNIIVTDNTRDDHIEQLINGYSNCLNIRYYRNEPMLNMTGNWNMAFEMADGEWVKLIHDDDWLATNTALEDFVEATKKGNRFIYCGRNDYYEGTGKYVPMSIDSNKFNAVSANPLMLYAGNVIGPPSVLMFHNSVKEYYDTALEWFVDIEYYIRMFKKESATYIPKALINMSYNETQVTNSVFNNPAVQIPELLHIFRAGLDEVNGLRTYDGFWRIMRNLGIRSVNDLEKYAQGREIPVLFKKIINHQKLVPQQLLKQGPVSKIAMAASYILN
jgi:glycosyltransferase involved in cell wall biosynthesis